MVKQTKPVRISLEAEHAAKEYGKTVSQGIITMHNELSMIPEPPRVFMTGAQCASVSGDSGVFTADISDGRVKFTAGNFTVEYWNKMKDIIDTTIKELQRGY